MPTNFDSLVDQVTDTTPAAPARPASAPAPTFDDLVDQVSGPDPTALHASLFDAAAANPQAEARRRGAGKVLGIDALLVPDNPQEMLRLKVNDAQAIALGNPNVAKFLSNPANARLAVDSIPGLLGLDTSINSYKPTAEGMKKAGQDTYTAENIAAFIDSYTATGRSPAEAAQVLTQYKDEGANLNEVLKSRRLGAEVAGTNVKHTLNAALFGLNESIYGVGRAAGDVLSPWMGLVMPQETADALANIMGEASASEAEKRASNEMARTIGSETEGAIYSGLQSGVQMLAMLPFGIAGKADTLLNLMGAQTFGASYQRAKDEGHGTLESFTYAAAQGMIEKATEMAPSMALIDGLKNNKPFMEMALNFAYKELGGEQVATVLQDLMDWAVLNPEQPFSTYLEARPGAAYQTLVATLVGAGVQVGGAKVIDATLRAIAPSSMPAADPMVALNLKQLAAAHQAQRAFEVLSDITAKAENDQLRALNTDAFHEFIGTSVEEPGALQEVFVSAKLLSESLATNNVSAEELQTKMPAVAAQLQEGAALEGDVRISLPDYLTYLAPTPVAQAILPHIRTVAGGLTYDESKAFFQEQVELDKKALEQSKVEGQPVLTREEWQAQNVANLEAEAAPVLDAVVEDLGPDLADAVASEVAADQDVQDSIQRVADENAQTTYEAYLKAHPNKKAVLMADANNVHNAILGELNATGRFPKSVNAGYAIPFREFYVQNAARMNILPSELFARMPLKFVADTSGLGDLLAQPVQNASLEDFAPGAVKDILSKHNWTILTAENPSNTYTPELNAERMERLREYLDTNGFTYQDVNGYYDRPEKSVIVFNISARQALDIGRMFDQESVLTRDGFIYQNGDVNPTTGLVTEFVSTAEAKNYYTDVPALGTVFNIDIDFQTTLKQGDHRAFEQNIGTAEDKGLAALYQEERKILLQTVAGGKLGEVTVTGTHFSRQQRAALDGRYFGTGVRGAERNRLANTQDARLRSRLAFYVDEGKGVFPESGVGSYKHVVQLDNMYDGATNPQRFPTTDPDGTPNFNRFEAAVLDAGFSGYYIEQGFGRQGVAVLLGEAAHGVQPAAGFNQSVSTRTPTPKAGRADPHLSTGLDVDIETLNAHPTFKAKLAKVVSQYTTFKKGPRSADNVIEAFIQQATDNLLWLYDQVPAETRERSKLWYVGGREIVDRWVEKYQGRYSDAQMAGALAAMSPKMGWDTNVSLSERIVDIYTNQQDTGWDDSMSVVADRIAAKNPNRVEAIDEVRGKTLADLDDVFLKGVWIRIYDEAHNDRRYRLVTPEGGFADYAATKSGPAVAAYGNGFGPIAKVVSILEDGSMANISRRLGEEHKVRNFYNNLFDPYDVTSVTIDTHAVAAALLLPLGASAVEVNASMGGAGAHDASGLSGSYVLYAEAYRRAAAQRGVLPREMQSITWEAVRGLFTPAYKTAHKKNPSALNAIWADYTTGKVTLDETRQRILDAASGIDNPRWVGSDPGLHEGAWASSYTSELLGARGPGRAAGPGAGSTATEGDSFFQSTHGWYYSQLARVIEGAKTESQPAAQWKAWLTANAPRFGLKKDEVQWTGLGDWLDTQSGRVSRSDILAYLNANGVQVEEVMLGKVSWQSEAALSLDAGESYSIGNATIDVAGGAYQVYIRGKYRTTTRNQMEALDYVQDRLDDAIDGAVKYARYQEPGGKNYRELLLTLPFDNEKGRAELRAFQERMKEKYGKINWKDDLTGEEGLEHDLILTRLAEQAPKFRSSHFDQPNILAHVRFNERVGANGARVLFIEEIQSDWGQKGKKDGFATPKSNGVSIDRTEPGVVWVLDNGGERVGGYSSTVSYGLSDAELLDKYHSGKGGTDRTVPTAPFVTDTKAWTALALKRMVAYAAENGFDAIAWTTGKQQADRYSLTKQIGSIEAKDYAGGVTVSVYGLDGQYRTARHFDSYDKPDIADFVGKEFARKVAEDRAAHTTDGEYARTYSGLDLEVGGEGMKAFYDQTVPSVARKVLRDMKADAEVTTLPLAADRFEVVDREGKVSGVVMSRKEFTDEWGFPWRLRKIANTSDQTGFVITDAMRAAVKDGLPLFQQNIGSFDPNSLTIALMSGANLSTVLHEGGHFYLRALELMSAMPEATAEQKADFQKVMDWFGVTREQWAAMSLDEQRPYHEQWAQSQERWMMESKAPTAEMQPVFSRFRAWLISVYKSVEQFLQANPLAGKLNDEIRGVFSRLIASDEAIAQAELARGYSLLFATEEDAAAAGVRGSEYQQYLDQYKKAHETSVESLQQRSLRDMKWVSNARSKAVRGLQKAAAGMRKAIHDQVYAEVMAEPINQARTFLATGEMTDPATGDLIRVAQGYKLDAETLREMYPATALGNPDMSKLRGMSAKDGLHPDMVAQMFGFSSGDQMVRELATAEDVKQKVDGITDQRMLEEHGDLVDKRAIEAAAEEAVHNEARARFMATGLKMLTKTPLSSFQMAKAAKEAAERSIAGKKVAEIRPAQYASQEARSAKQALQLAPKDPLGAANAQRAALLNNRMAQAATEAQAEVKKILKYISKFKNEGTRKALHLDYLEQIDQLLAAFDPNPATTLKSIAARQSLADWVLQQQSMGYEPILSPEQLSSLKRVSYKEMTMEELRGFYDGIREIEHHARQIKKMLTAIDKREFREHMLEAEQSIIANANRTVEERATPDDAIGKLGAFFRGFAASHRKFASFLREMDGSKYGVMSRLLLRPMNEAGGREVQMRADASARFAAMFAPIRASLHEGVVPPSIAAKKSLVPGTNLSMTTEQRVMFAFYWGDPGTRQRLMDGGMTGTRALAPQDAAAILDTLTKEQFDFVQQVHDFYEEYRPLIEAQERELTGKTPEWIEPAPFNTKFGTYRGGYAPAKYDPRLSTRSEQLEAVTDLRTAMRGAFGAAAARHPYTQHRAPEVTGRPLLLSFSAFGRHINEVTHRLAWQSWLIDASRTLKALDGVIRQHYGADVMEQLNKTVVEIAQGQAVATTMAERGLNHVRTGSTIVGLGWRLTTALLQPTGLFQSWSRIGGAAVAKGVAQYLSAPNEAAAAIVEKDVNMANRWRTMNREINEILNTVRTNEQMTALEASFFYTIGFMQKTVDIPTYIGAYEQALETLKYEEAGSESERKAIEEDARAQAYQAVVDSQSGGSLQDLAQIQRGGPVWKIWTNFYSYFSATYNMNIEAYRRTDFKSPSEVGLFAADMVILNILPVIFSTLLYQLTRGSCDADDLECISRSYAADQVNFLFSQMILLREIGAGVGAAIGGKNYGYSGPAGIRFFDEVYKLGQQVKQGDADMAFFKAANSILGMVFHYPAGQINSTVEGIMAVENGDVEGAGILPAVLFGPPKH